MLSGISHLPSRRAFSAECPFTSQVSEQRFVVANGRWYSAASLVPSDADQVSLILDHIKGRSFIESDTRLVILPTMPASGVQLTPADDGSIWLRLKGCGVYLDSNRSPSPTLHL
jgi:hypothetical protein